MTEISAGSVIAGRYRLEQRLDAGGRAQVWRGRDDELSRDVAIKILVTPEGGDPSFVDAFRSEAQSEANLKHPNIVEVFDWGHDGDVNYIVMEFLEGQTVKKLLEGGTFAPDRVITVGRQAAAALAFAHASSIAHGLVGPENIMIDASGHTTVLGFGLQCRGVCETPPSPDSDTHMLGLVLFEMLTGYDAAGPRPASLPENQPWPERPHKLNSAVPGELDHIVWKAIDPDPANRYQAASALQADLDELARPKSRAWLWILLAVLAVILAVAGTFFIVTQQKVTVPDLVGKTQAEATTQLSSVGLKLVVTGQATSNSIPVGSIVSETPTPGVKVRKGSSVGVTVSTGKPQAGVPTLTGLTLDQATSSIATAGLVVGTVTHQNNSAFPANAVISQTPAAGTQVVLGSAVNLVVSSGQAHVTMPALIGMSQASATSKLDGLGLHVDVGTALTSAQPAGVVYAQGPAAGTQVPAGGTVTISVSQGVAPVTVPNVVGAAASDAKTSLQNRGLVPVSVEESSSATVGTVFDQTPAAGSKVSPGTQVKIFISK